MAKTSLTKTSKCKNCGEDVAQMDVQGTLTWVHVDVTVPMPSKITEMRIYCNPPAAEPI